MPVKVRLRYPEVLEEKARRVATVFKHPNVEVELVPDNIDEIVIEGPSFATTDVTRATAMLRRYFLVLKRRNGSSK